MINERSALIMGVSILLSAIILKSGYTVAGTNNAAYVVNNMTGAVWHCFGDCRLLGEDRSR